MGSLPKRIVQMAWLPALLALLLSTASAFAAEVIPPKPDQYFNDYAGVTSPATRQRLNTLLENLEKTDSTQIIVAVFPKMESETSIEDYTVQVARAWGVGQSETDNGAILFVFLEDRTMRIEVGYGLEGAIPDIIANRIIEERIVPHFRAGNIEQGLIAGVEALVQAARGEYQGTGRTAAGSESRERGPGWFPLFIIIFIILGIVGRIRRRGGHMYSHGRRRRYASPWLIGGIGFGGRGGGFGGGGFGGGFSGGGGSFGGGGASGSW